VRRVFLDHAPQTVVDDEKPGGELRLPVGRKRPAGEEAQAIALERHHAPAGAAQAGVDAEDANQAAHDDLVDSPASGNSLGRSRRSPTLDFEEPRRAGALSTCASPAAPPVRRAPLPLSAASPAG
jgi:hypothetical protein